MDEAPSIDGDVTVVAARGDGLDSSTRATALARVGEAAIRSTESGMVTSRTVRPITTAASNAPDRAESDSRRRPTPCQRIRASSDLFSVQRSRQNDFGRARLTSGVVAG